MKATTIVLIIVLFLASFIGGAAFWFYQKATRLAQTAVNITASSSPNPSNIISASPDFFMPTTDVEGRDIPDIQRYPGSIRSGYYRNEDGSFTSVDYFAREESEKILEFYKKELTSWNILSENQKVLTLSKEGRELTIEIMDEDKINKLTQYSISLLIIKTE